jgi:hypothetical protein
MVLNLRDAARHELNAEPSPPRDAEVARLAPLVTQDEIDDWVLSDDRPEFF